MPHGGKRPNAGRPNGSKNKRTVEANAFLAKILTDEREEKCWDKLLTCADIQVFMTSFFKAVAYKRGQPAASHEVGGMEGGPITVKVISSVERPQR